MGFAWAGGTASKFVGEDLEVTRLTDDSYSINARYNSDDPYTDGFRADERLEMTITDIEFVSDGSDLRLKTSQSFDKKIN